VWVRGPGGRQHELVIVLVRSLMGAISGRRPLGLTSRLRASCPLCWAGGRLACDSCVHDPSVGGHSVAGARKLETHAGTYMATSIQDVAANQHHYNSKNSLSSPSSAGKDAAADMGQG